MSPAELIDVALMKLAQWRRFFKTQQLCSRLLFFQVMKPTRTSSETFPTWPQTTLRSSSAAALTPKLNRLFFPLAVRFCAVTKHTRFQRAGMLSFLPWLPAMCSVIAQLVLTSEGTNSSIQRILCASTSEQNNCCQVGAVEQLYESSMRCCSVYSHSANIPN